MPPPKKKGFLSVTNFGFWNNMQFWANEWVEPDMENYVWKCIVLCYIYSPTRYTTFVIYSQCVWQLDMFRTYRSETCRAVKHIVNKYSTIPKLCILLDYICNIARWYTVLTISKKNTVLCFLLRHIFLVLSALRRVCTFGPVFCDVTWPCCL